MTLGSGFGSGSEISGWAAGVEGELGTEVVPWNPYAEGPFADIEGWYEDGMVFEMPARFLFLPGGVDDEMDLFCFDVHAVSAPLLRLLARVTEMWWVEIVPGGRGRPHALTVTLWRRDTLYSPTDALRF